MKKILVLLTFLSSSVFLRAQEAGEYRGSLDLGVSVPGGGIGALSNLEINYNLSDNMRAGLRIGSGLFVRDLERDSDNDFESGDFSSNLSFAGTYDYCFNSGGALVPYVGAGLGVFIAAGYAGRDGEDYSFSVLEWSPNFGGFLRAGFEVGKFRVGAEYNFIPDVPLIDAEGIQVGDMSNSYLGFTVGFFVGGGTW